MAVMKISIDNYSLQDDIIIHQIAVEKAYNLLRASCLDYGTAASQRDSS